MDLRHAKIPCIVPHTAQAGTVYGIAQQASIYAKPEGVPQRIAGLMAPWPRRIARAGDIITIVAEFTLCLGQGASWVFGGSGAAAGWLESFAKALGLSAAREGTGRRIVFEEMQRRPNAFFGPVLQRCLKELPRGKWKVREFNDIALFAHPCFDGLLCELEPMEEWRGRVDQMRRSLLPVYTDALAHGGLPIHGALIAVDGKGVILAGRSGAGKSTACRRLPHPWQALGDDLCLVMPDGPAGYRVHPLPTWSAFREDGASGACRSASSVPLRAFFFLEKFPVDEYRALKRSASAISMAASALEVFRSIDLEFPRREEPRVKKALYANAASMATAIPSFLLRVSLTGRFWERIEEALGLPETRGASPKAIWRQRGTDAGHDAHGPLLEHCHLLKEC